MNKSAIEIDRVFLSTIDASKAFVEYPVETIFTAINGTKNLLELAKSKQV